MNCQLVTARDNCQLTIQKYSQICPFSITISCKLCFWVIDFILLLTGYQFLQKTTIYVIHFCT